jgi:hypothetical protein
LIGLPLVPGAGGVVRVGIWRLSSRDVNGAIVRPQQQRTPAGRQRRWRKIL